MAEQVLHHMFWRCAERRPEAPALSLATSAGRVELTYAELERAAGRVADALAAADVPPHAPVVIIAERGPGLVIAMLGTLVAGAAFVVANPAHPADRLHHMITAARPAAVLLDDGVPEALQTLIETEFSSLPILSITDDLSTPRLGQRPTIARDDLAYVAFTSGSTGRPKGIPHRHATLQQFVDWQAVAFGVTSGSRMAALAPPGFDVSYCEVFGALTQGASIHLVTEDVRNDPAELVRWLRSERISLLQIVPAQWSALLAEMQRTPAELPDLATVMFVGEALSPGLVTQTRDLLGRALNLVNVYGPTEVVAATFHPIGELAPELRTVPIGDAIPGRQITLRDEHGALADEGEICITSRYLTAGYLGDDAATAERFVQLPDSDQTTYRTGDVARRLPDGNLLFVGRTDNQVKIRGQRVELEDVEAAILGTGNVLAAAALVRPSDAGASILSAFVVPRDPAAFDAEALLAEVGDVLPPYMVPAVVVPVDALPRNANGKIDRAAVAELQGPDADAGSGGTVEGPQGETEVAVAEIWRELLKQDDIDRSASLFRIGGDSLVATRILSRVRARLGVRVSLGTFFDEPTIAGLAAAAMSAPASPRIGGAKEVSAAR